MHTRIAGGCLCHASVALGKPIKAKEKVDILSFFYTPHHFLSFSLLHTLLKYVDTEIVTKEATTEHTILSRIILTQYYILVKLFYCYFMHSLSDKLYVSSLVTACRCFYVYEVLILSNLKARL